MDKLVIATRESPLALAQTEYVKAHLNALLPNTTISLLPMKTKGDKFLETTLDKIGGKGLFTKELETAILSGKAQLAVHSMKDVPSTHPEGLTIAAILEREDPRDVFISNKYKTFSSLPQNALIGTSSIRRKSQLLALNPHLNIKPLRGNINTRLKKATDFDGIILAYAGIKRLKLESVINESFSLTSLLPATGQGALGIECLSSNQELIRILSQLNDSDTAIAVSAERMITAGLGGNCHTPLAAHAKINGQEMILDALVASPDGKKIIKEHIEGDKTHYQSLAHTLLHSLIQRDAKKLLNNLKQ